MKCNLVNFEIPISFSIALHRSQKCIVMGIIIIWYLYSNINRYYLLTCCIISWIQRSRLYSFNQGFYNSFIALISFIFCFSYLRDYILELKCIKSLILSWKFRNILCCDLTEKVYLTWRISNDFGVDNKDEHKSDCSTI